jgi:hypothetical protein
MFAASMLAASGSFAQVTVQGSEVTLRWAPAAGAVSGYQVFLSRNGGDPTDLSLISTNEVTITGQPGDVVQIAVRAYGFPNGPTQGFEWGPASELSDPIRFAGEPVARDVYPMLDCVNCRRFELRDANGDAVLTAPHPSPGTWDLLGTGTLENGSGHALLRERVSGALMIEIMSGTSMVPFSSVIAPGFAGMTVSRPVDLDADGVDEFVMHDPATGEVKIWGMEDEVITELSRCDVQPSWRLIGFGDFDGDGQRDAWFDFALGNVVVIHLRDLEAVTSTFISNPVSGTSAVDVADYDGDGRSDLLRRNDFSGALHVSLLRGSLSAPTQDVRALATQSGDWNVVPRGSRDIDGLPGAEILLQDQGTGAVDAAFPVDPVAGRRERLANASADWKLIEVQ